MISIVTVVIYRQEHLSRSASALSRLQCQQEHIIIHYDLFLLSSGMNFLLRAELN